MRGWGGTGAGDRNMCGEFGVLNCHGHLALCTYVCVSGGGESGMVGMATNLSGWLELSVKCKLFFSKQSAGIALTPS